MTTSHFDEKTSGGGGGGGGGIVQCQTPWGRWWQTISEVHIEVDISPRDYVGPSRPQLMSTKAKDIKVDVKPKQIRCQVHGKTIFEGKLCRTVVADETVWTIRRDNNGGSVPVGSAKATASQDGASHGDLLDETLDIQLTKAEPYYLVPVWSSLLLDGGQFAPDAWTFDEMRRKVDIEKFQIENPGFDFSKAKLSKTYD